MSLFFAAWFMANFISIPRKWPLGKWVLTITRRSVCSGIGLLHLPAWVFSYLAQCFTLWQAPWVFMSSVSVAFFFHYFHLQTLSFPHARCMFWRLYSINSRWNPWCKTLRPSFDFSLSRFLRAQVGCFSDCSLWLVPVKAVICLCSCDSVLPLGKVTFPV